MPQPINNDLLHLRKLKLAYTEAKRVADNAKAEFDKHQAAVLERMEAEGVESLKADGTHFIPTKTLYASVQDREEFVAWALQNEPELVQHKERGDLINALVRQCIDDGVATPPGLGFYERAYISQRSG